VSDPLLLIMTSATLGQALLSLSLILSRTERRAADTPLMIVLCAALVLLATATLTSWSALDRGVLFTASLPASLALAPALALYIEALTTERPWRCERRHALRFCLAALSLLAIPMVLFLSPDERHWMFTEGRAGGGAYSRFAGACLFGLIVAGSVLGGLYAWRSLGRLAMYRRRLETLFANNDRRELWWLTALLGVVLGAWALSVISLMADSLISAPLLAPVVAQTLGWIAIWALSLFGLGQPPGFDGRWVEPQTSTASVSPKYRKSALTSQQADRVAGRIESIMRAERLYLDPALSLPKLAARLNISPNLVSQTLNERLGKSFFAYVNAWRIEAAAPLVLAREHSMLEIALEVGFNSKSAFYKSFNVSFGMSPSSYLKRCATTPPTSAQQTDQALEGAQGVRLCKRIPQ